MNLVVLALQELPLEPIGSITLTHKVTFLVAVTSVRHVSKLAAFSHKEPFFWSEGQGSITAQDFLLA